MTAATFPMSVPTSQPFPRVTRPRPMTAPEKITVEETTGPNGIRAYLVTGPARMPVLFPIDTTRHFCKSGWHILATGVSDGCAPAA